MRSAGERAALTLPLPSIWCGSWHPSLEATNSFLTDDGMNRCEVSLDDAADLDARATALLPRPKLPVVVFCDSGRRAAFAKAVLERQGFEYVINAGGVNAVMECLLASL